MSVMKRTFTVVVVIVAAVIFASYLLLRINVPKSWRSDPTNLSSSEAHSSKHGSASTQYGLSEHIPAFPTKLPSSEAHSSRHGSRPASTQYGYAYILDTLGQQSAGMRGVLSLQCWVASFGLPVHIVEPVIVSGHLTSASKQFLEGKHDTLTFSDIVNVTHFNEESRKEGFPTLVGAKEFLNKAPRKKVVLKMFKVKCGHDKVDFLWKDCSSDAISNNLVEYNFHVVQTACIKYCANNITLPLIDANVITRHIYQQYKPNEVTLEVRAWNGELFIPSSKMKDPMHCRGLSIQRQEIISPSSRVLLDAKNYLRQYARSGFVITIMLRFEWFIAANNKYKRNPLNEIKSCADKTKTELERIRQKEVDSSLVVTADVGESSSFKRTIVRAKATVTYEDIFDVGTSFITELYEHKWKYTQWKDSFTKSSTSSDSGYVAAMHRAIAANSSCLILFGGGAYQKLALLDYIKNHPDPSEWCIRFICIQKNADTQDYQNITHNLVSLQ